MSHFAIIIGIDDYAEPEWKLTAAVDDALAFREWALGPGAVPPENVHLLLSPAPGREPGVPYAPADSEHITEVIQQFQQGRGAGGERLYFYFAGHGAAAPGAHDEVVIIPVDVRSWRRDARRCVGFSEILPPLQQSGPAAQFFFIDACRDLILEDFTRGAGPVVGRWRGPPEQGTPQQRAGQYLLYATSPGGRAVETGQGVFGRLLLQGLKGSPGALLWSNRERCYELRFSQLAEYIRTEVEAQVKRLGGRWRQFLQVPEQDIPPGPSGPKDFLLARFSPEQVGTLSLRVRVGPRRARSNCVVAVLYYAPGGFEIPLKTVRPEPPSPLPFPLELELPPGDYTLSAEALKFGEAREPCSLYRPQSVDLTLQDLGITARQPEDVETMEQPVYRSGPVASHLQTPLGEPLHPSIIIRSEDPHTRLVVLDSEGQTHSGFGRVTVDKAPFGIYRARLLLPEDATQEQVFAVHRDGYDHFMLEALPPAMGEPQLDRLQALGIRMDLHGYTPSLGDLGPVARLRLASLLGFAAFTASAGASPSSGGNLTRLRIQPPRPVPPGGAGLLVLLGASGSQPVPGSSLLEFLAQSRLVLHGPGTGQPAWEGTFQKLPGFWVAAQWARPVAPGPWILELHLPGLAPTRYALTALRDRISILSIVVDDSGDIEVQQYLAPLPGAEARHPGLPRFEPRALRHLELGQRYLASGSAIPQRHLQPLLMGECVDPILGCIAGYGLVREGRAERYRSFTFNSRERSAMRDMLRFFDGLPDVHVLAGLCEPQQRDAHFQRALERGLPLFADGLLALQRHLGPGRHPLLDEAHSGLLPGSSWTAWLER